MGTYVGENLTGLDYVALIVPVLVVLFGLIGGVYWADSHPSVRHVGEPRTYGRAREPLPAHGHVTAGTTLAGGAADEVTGSRAASHHAGAPPAAEPPPQADQSTTEPPGQAEQ
jgi:hypothetical protein